jgi:putative tryptophan/tyrosine transport system substrate-binding protein
MKRREFIAGLGGAVALPVVARAQLPERIRHLGVLSGGSQSDPDTQGQVAEFRQGLQELGWTEGGNLRIDYRWGEGDADKTRRYAAELIALAPDAILTLSGFALGALLPATRTVPIVFTGTIDPVGAGLVATLARPGGNATGFSTFEYSLSAKWLERLKQIAPRVTRVAIIRLATSTTGAGFAQFAAIQAVASSFKVELSPIDARNAGEIERAVTAFALTSNGGLIVTASTRAVVLRETIIALAARHRLPAVYPLRSFVTGGGLISFGPVLTDVYRRAASYVDRILKGEKPSDLPVQAPTKYETVINLKTSKALGLTIPETLLATADEVIQ